MWKQFLSKISHKASKAEAGSDSLSSSHSNGNDASLGNTIHRTSTGNLASTKSAVAVKRMSSSVFPSSIVARIEPLLSFNDVSNADKPNLFISKLNLCCVVYDFSDLNKNYSEKDLKRQILVDLVDYFHSGPHRFTEPMIAACCKMFAVNLFRVFPPNYRSNKGTGEHDEEEPIFDPAWSHLQLVYDLLLQFISSVSLDAKVAKKYVDHSFIFSLLDLFDSEDPRERECLKMVLHRVYGKFMVHRPFIRKTVTNIFFLFIFETQRHNGIAELLEVFGSVISGFALPLKEEHKIFLWRTLIPLHKPKTIGLYFQQLTYCITQFIEKDPRLASTVILGLLKYWPGTNSQKEVMFLSEVEEILESITVIEFQKCMVPLFRRIGYCLNNSHFQVAERALLLWNNDHIMNVVSQNRHAIAPLIIPALERNARGHWNQAVKNMTLNVTKMLLEMDEELILACKNKFEEDEGNRTSAEEKRRAMWERLDKTASAFHPMTGRIAVLLASACIFSLAVRVGPGQFQQKFTREGPDPTHLTNEEQMELGFHLSGIKKH